MLTAWTPTERVLVIDRLEFRGDVSVPNAGAWKKFLSWLDRKPTWTTVAGRRLPLFAIAVDAGAVATTVYRMKAPIGSIIGHHRIKLVKGAGRNSVNTPVATGKPGRGHVDSKRFVPLYTVGTHQAKKTLINRMNEKDIIQYDPTLEPEVFKELAAEHMIRKKGGAEKFEQTRQRNEALDCLVYALALIKIMKPKWLKQDELEPKKADPKPETVKEDETKIELTVRPEKQEKPEPKQRYTTVWGV